MDETVGDVPSEGGDSSRRFGIYRAFTPEPRVFTISRLSLLFVACIAGVLGVAVFFPMLQFASSSSKPVLPFPEIANKSSEKDNFNTNCSSNVLSFGHDCTETSQPSTKETNNLYFQNDEPSVVTETTQFETSTIALEDDSEVVAESRHVKILRTGRSKWPVVSTPYPYYLPKPTQTRGITERVESDVEEAFIFAIPSDMNQENITSYSNNKNKPRVNFTPPPYAFTPFPNFTDSYAQLLPYKVPTNYTNFEEILKYLNSNEEKFVTSSTEKPFFGNRRLATMKVSGTYRMPLDIRGTGDNPDSSTEKTGEARPFFNGHAYISDPFVKYRPSNPIDVNRLVPLRPDIGLRFRRPFPANPSTPLAEIVTHDSQDRDLYGAAGGSYTEAVFHGAGSVSQPSDLLTPPPQDKPLSVTLDIYPVTMEMPVSEPPGGTTTPKWRGRFRHQPRLRWRPQAGRTPAVQLQTQQPPPPSPPRPADNHMVVHLNLFPNKRKPYTFPRRGGDDSSSPASQKTALLVGGRFGARSLTEPLEIKKMSDQTRVTAIPVTSTRHSSTTTYNLPEYSALTAGLPEPGVGEPTTEVTGNRSKGEVVSADRKLKESETNATVNDDNANNTASTIDKESKDLFMNSSSSGRMNGSKAGILSSLEDADHISTLAGQGDVNGSVKIAQIYNTTQAKGNPVIELDDVTFQDDDVFVSTEPFNEII